MTIRHYTQEAAPSASPPPLPAKNQPLPDGPANPPPIMRRETLAVFGVLLALALGVTVVWLAAWTVSAVSETRKIVKQNNEILQDERKERESRKLKGQPDLDDEIERIRSGRWHR